GRAAMMKVRFWLAATSLLVALAMLLPAPGMTAQKEEKKEEKKKGEKKKEKKAKEVWTSADDPTIPIDVKYQGEYATKEAGLGCQFSARGMGKLRASDGEGGLPGGGWKGKNKSRMPGPRSKNKVRFEPAKGKRRYLAKKPEEFSATRKFPPPGQKEYSGTGTP